MKKEKNSKLLVLLMLKGNPAPDSYDGYVSKEIALRGKPLMVNGKDVRYSVGLTVRESLISKRSYMKLLKI